MIPKIIHYCWFGGNPLPKSAIKCINSWKKYFPDYDIKEWNESNFDLNIIPYTQKAYSEKKYAFVSDYARFWILYKYGGIYFDTDVEVIKNMNDIVDRGAFMGCENEVNKNCSKSLGVAPGLGLGVNPGLGLGVNPGLGLYKKILNVYENMSFGLNKNGDLLTVVDIVTDILVKEGLMATNEVQYIGGVYIYPKDFFCPLNYQTGKLIVTKNTRTIHHYTASWMPWYYRYEQSFWNLCGMKNLKLILRLNNLLKHGTFRAIP